MRPAAVQIINNSHKVPLFESCKEFEIAFTNRAVPEKTTRMSKIAPRSHVIKLIATTSLEMLTPELCGSASLHDR